jgi:hypothetical protein
MTDINSSDLVFSISKEDLQIEAYEQIGRLLSEDEIDTAKKMLEFGIHTSIDVVYQTIFFELVNNLKESEK